MLESLSGDRHDDAWWLLGQFGRPRLDRRLQQLADFVGGFPFARGVAEVHGGARSRPSMVRLPVSVTFQSASRSRLAVFSAAPATSEMLKTRTSAFARRRASDDSAPVVEVVE